MRSWLFLLLASTFGCTVSAQVPEHWEMLVADSAIWYYLAPDQQPPADWNSLAFDDSAWPTGKGGFGYGDGDDSTVVMANTIFIRHTFNIADATDWTELRIAVDHDDGYVAYLNGVEISRRNMGAAGSAVAFDALSSAQHEAVLYTGGTPETDAVPIALLQTGNNVLAVQVHNRSLNSSDLSCRPFLFGATSLTDGGFADIPAWFVPPLVFSTHLPLVVLNTFGQAIPDDPRIVVHMGIVDNGPGNLNSQNDPFNGYDGLINIETRGSSSQGFPKKQYALETQDSLGNSMNVPLMGLPSENDWILHAPYSDKTLMRNYLVYNWWRDMGWYTSRTRFCEVILNGDYQGVYVLMEQIKWDNNRVDVEKLDTDDLAGDSLTGGYIFKVDKTTGSGQFDWTSHVDTFQGQPKITRFQYDYPNRDNIAPDQETYLQQFVHDWEQSLIDSTFAQPDIGYRRYVDVNSFIDYFLIQEITKNVDGYRLSTYLNKQRDSRGGRLQAGPAWDFNITLGNANYCEGGETENYALDFPCGQEVIPFWWHRMNQDSVYWNQVKCRYLELRSDLWGWNRINARIDSTVLLLGDATDRNFQRWNILNSYVWPNNWVAGTYPNEIDSLKQWIQLRLAWLDAAIGLPSGTCLSSFTPMVTLSEINYHSADTFNTDDWIELQNLTTDTVDLSFWTLTDGNEFNTFTFPMGTRILPDSFLVVVRNNTLFTALNPEVEHWTGPFNWGIGNGGDQLTLRDMNNEKVFSITFDDQPPWPTLPDGNGHTLEKWDWATDLNNPASWHEGCPGGSPGRSFTYCVYASAEDLQNERPLFIYPNPTTGTVHVQTHDAATLNILNLAGQLVYTCHLQQGTNHIDLSMLHQGMYLTELTLPNHTRSVSRLMIN